MSGEYVQVVEGPTVGTSIPVSGEQDFGKRAEPRLGTGLLWLSRWEHLRSSTRTGLLSVTVFACLFGIFMNINFFLMSGESFPLLVAKDSFGEGVGLDLIFPCLQAIVAAVALWTLSSINRARRAQAALSG